ncbi:hydroperoxide isomerase ALOXE3-like [Engystomops pustulosus]|uniref:hydroperoxide isomerase ALOXE3-like n=1 Tax=Engystomops pustulosus TaxID=76066 RepID=UPI003AFA53A9
MGVYEVTVVTGEDIRSGAIDTISISLVGVNGESAKKKLSHLWIPGSVSHYKVDTELDLGELQAVRLYKETYLIPVQDSWYCRYVHVLSPDGKLHQFPVYQWISGQTSVLIPHGKGRILSRTSGKEEEQKSRELEENRDIYKWKMYALGVPYCIHADGVQDLPLNEQYSSVKDISFQLNRSLVRIKGGLKGLMKCTHSWRSLEDMRAGFCFHRSDIAEEVSRIWDEDNFFGYQFLNGVNPMVIRKCQKLPESFTVTSGMVASSLGTSRNLHEELKNGNIFLADYKILQGIPANDSINGKKQYIAAPMCLLWKDPQDRLLPIAIQLGQSPGEQTPIFLPSDSKWDWTLAKIWVRNADYQVLETVYHLLHTHLFAEVFNIATHRQLPRNHPVYKLLIPHLRFILDINTRARKELFGPGGIYDEIIALGKGGCDHLLRKAMEEVTYRGLCLPDDIEDRGLESVPNFYYRDDGRLIWEAVESFVSSMMRYYYESDESVRTDPELQAWAAEIYHKGFLSNESSGIPSSLETVSSLVKYLTMVIFRCSAQHAAVSRGQFDFFAWVPNGPSSMKSPPPGAKGVSTLQSVLDALPDVSSTTIGMVTAWQLSSEPQDRRPLGTYPDVHFVEENPQQFIQEFQEKLAEISKTINGRNQSRRLSYLYLDPKLIENSVSI